MKIRTSPCIVFDNINIFYSLILFYLSFLFSIKTPYHIILYNVIFCKSSLSFAQITYICAKCLAFKLKIERNLY